MHLILVHAGTVEAVQFDDLSKEKGGGMGAGKAPVVNDEVARDGAGGRTPPDFGILTTVMRLP